MDPTSLALPHVRLLHAYTPGLQPTEAGWVKLNTNECPYPPSPRVVEALRAEIGEDGDRLRLYPNPKSDPLRRAIAKLHGLQESNVCVGNGSDDILNLLVRGFCAQSAEAGFTFPSYSLYPVLVSIQDGRTDIIELDRSMKLPIERLAKSEARAFFLTSPNAPTGVGFRRAEIEQLLQRFSGLLVVDEAYAPFAEEDALPLLGLYANLVVVRTLSKAYALAGIRVGYALANAVVIDLLDRIRDSYNVSRLSQVAAIAALSDQGYYAAIIDKVKATRDFYLHEWTQKFGWFTYPSQTNFIFTEPRNVRDEAGPAVAKAAYDFLHAHKVLVRYFPSHALTASFLRISVGNDDEMLVLNETLEAWRKKRIATLARKTAETDISLTLALEGQGIAKIDTGVAFFDHMLTLFAKHGLFDLEVKCVGDVAVDYHHTVEDVGLVLGEAFKQALGDKRGIRRYGFFLLPMDESLARVVVDLGGRPHLVYEANPPTFFIRDFNLVLVKEFCRAFSNALGANLHVKLEYGEEPHHVAEAIFKGLARAMDVATQIDARMLDQLPSTKGTL